MVYCNFTGHCDICGKNNLYVSHHFDIGENDEITNSKMVCIDCNDKRMNADLWKDYNKGGREVLKYLEEHRADELRSREDIKKETAEILERRRGIKGELIDGL